MPECPDCEQEFDGRRCRCGYMATRPVTSDRKPRTCPFDGAQLEPDGYCHAGSGYPVTVLCPFACPHCRQPLDWSGACLACYGAASGRREDWSFPGMGHDLVEGHWRPDPARPVHRRACTPEENTAGFAAIRRILATAPPLPGPDPSQRRGNIRPASDRSKRI